MNPKAFVVPIALFALALTPLAAGAADVPGVIVHEGYVTDKSGNPLDGPVNMSFGIYKSASADDLVWEETPGDVTVANGFYAVELGKNLPFDTTFSDNAELYLELRMKGKKLTPRQRLGAVPYSLVCRDATGDINPKSVSVGGSTVIDNSGKWVGDTTGLAGVTSVTATTPLTGGTITGTGSIGIPKATASADGYLASADFTTFAGKQDRVAGTCNLNFCAVSVNSDGSLNCEPCGGSGSGTVTSVATGPGLTGGPIVASGTISLDTPFLDGSTYDARFVNESQAQCISTAMLQDGAVTSGKIADGTIAFADVGANTCTGNQIMKRNAGNTAWVCDNDKDTVYSNGTGLSLSSNQFSLGASYQDGSAYDSRFVNANGDTMSGTLNLTSNGLTVGTTQVAVVGGNVGVGTATPQAKLDVRGDIFIPGGADPVVDCDGTATTGVGACEAISDGSTLVAVQGVDNICADSLTAPTIAFLHLGSKTTQCNTTDGIVSKLIGNPAAATQYTAVGAEWAYKDTGATPGLYDNGEDLYVDLIPTAKYYSSGGGGVSIGTMSTGAKLFVDGLVELAGDVRVRTWFYSASDSMLKEDVAEWSTTVAGYWKVKTINVPVFPTYVTNEFRISFDLRGNTGNGVYGRIYRNGSPVGTEFSDTDTVYSTYTQDIAGWVPGDSIELWAKRDGGTVYVRNFIVRGSSNAVTKLMGQQVAPTW